MKNMEDFDIKNGVLIKYYGPGGDVVIPEGITDIEQFAFDEQSDITSVVIPTGVKTIGVRAFYKCSLSRVVIPEGVTCIKHGAFAYCNQLENLVIPKGVTNIEYQAFYRCKGLKKVRILESAVNIGEEAFEDCSNLSSVEIPEGLKSIGSNAFRGCRKLADENGCVIIDGCPILIDYYRGGGDVVITKGVQIIGENAFSCHSNIKSIKIPKGVEIIEKGAFSLCNSITSIKIPDGVTSIEDLAFFGCSGLKSVTLPDSLIRIGPHAFEACRRLVSVEIPKGVTKIEDYTFWKCRSLESVMIPDGVTSIGEGAFQGCKSLTSVIIPEGTTKIGDNPFGGCCNLSVICHTPYAVSRLERRKNLYFIYLRGPLSDLPEEYWRRAAKGFIYAQEHGITEIDKWREAYLEYIRDHIEDYVEYAKLNRLILFFLINERLLDEMGTRLLQNQYDNTDDEEVKAALLKYRQDKFEAGDST